eukprot:338850-Pyramimonas_sp.AAC.1
MPPGNRPLEMTPRVRGTCKHLSAVNAYVADCECMCKISDVVNLTKVIYVVPSVGKFHFTLLAFNLELTREHG